MGSWPRPGAIASHILLASLALVLWLAPAFADLTFPQLTDRVVDDAHLLSADDIASLTADLKALEDKSSDQVVVVTVPSLQDTSVEDYGYQLGRKWGIGTAAKNNGVLLIVAPKEHKVRIEVGRGLEPILTDAMSRVIIENAILPQFRQGHFAQGIKAGVRDIVLTLTGDAAEVADRAKARHDADDPKIDWMTVILWTLLILFFIYVTWRSSRSNYARNGSGRGPIFIPGPGWGGGGGGGDFGGGGFSGGGGDFGGGGASGSW